MEINNDSLYDFHKSYEKEWKKFISQFPDDNELEHDSLTLEIKECCSKLNRKFQYLYENDPSYSSQMEIRRQWKELEFIVNEYKSVYTEQIHSWFVAQIVNMINCNNKEIVESTWYTLAVDYFECTTEGAWLFPKMYQVLSGKNLEKLVCYSISIPWKYKIETYRSMILNTNHHEILADAIYRSCKAYCYGSCKSSEAIEILEQLTIPNKQYKEVHEILNTPIQVEILEVIEQKEFPNDEITGFVSIHHMECKTIPTWFPYASLWIDKNCIGTFNENYNDIRWKEWNSINSIYRIPIPKKQKHQEHILCVKVPFNINWKNKKAFLKPI